MPTNTSQASMPSSRDFGKMVALSFPRIGIMYTPYSAPQFKAAAAIAWVILSSVWGSTTIKTSSPGLTAIRLPRRYCARSIHSIILLSLIVHSPRFFYYLTVSASSRFKLSACHCSLFHSCLFSFSVPHEVWLYTIKSAHTYKQIYPFANML